MLLDALRQVLGNRSIRRAEAAWLIGIAAQWAWFVTVLVYAYDLGGVTAVGLAGMLRMLPAAILAPFVTAITDRVAPGRVLLGVHLGSAASVAFAALVVLTDLPGVLVFVAVVVEGLLAVLHRPTTMALLPALVRSPQELVASNAVTSTGEGVGVLVGPALGGALLALGGAALGMAVPAIAFTAAAVAVLIIDVRHPTHRTAEPTASRLAEIFGGFRALRTYPSAGLVLGLFGAQTFVRGTLTVLIVALSVELLRLGEAGVGYLNSAIGAGGLAGSVLAIALVTRRHMSIPFVLALALWGAPIAVLGWVPAPWLAFVALGVVGLANAVLDVSGFTLLQRCVPTRVRGRVFGALEGVAALTVGLGALLAPPIIGLLGLEGAMVAVGLLLPTLALLSAPFVRRADEAAIVPHRQLSLLRGVPMFAPLPMNTLEYLARSLGREQHAVDAMVIEQGAVGDSWYLIESGRVAVVHDGRHVTDLSTGDGFGEIALLSDRPRTASVIAREPLEVFRLPRADFLEAVTGSAHAVVAADELVSKRLTELGHGGDAGHDHPPS
jgi:MFS family permease